MKRMLALLIVLLTLPCPGLAHTREEVRDAYRALDPWAGGSPYAEAPSATPPYGAGALSEGALSDATDYVNFIRWLAGVDPVADSNIYNYQCQRGAVLLAALNYVDHNAPRPADMDVNFYDSAHLGTTSGNIARFNWMRDSILRDGVAYFVRDDGDRNLETLGHRRWLLNPLMGATGFGLCNSEDGMSYVVMYAHDLGHSDARWEKVCWPAPGAFPAELMHDHLAWSVVLNPEIYDLAASSPRVTLAEAASGLSFAFEPGAGRGDGWCAVNLEGYGGGGAIIFRPDFKAMDFTDYQQNQRWTVEVTGLRTVDGGEAALEYAVDMISLYVQDPVNVEISALEAELRPGETLQLTADVVPAYADDLTVAWASSAPEIAAVDDHGVVTALRPGACEILCADALGHTDACALTVTGE